MSTQPKETAVEVQQVTQRFFAPETLEGFNTEESPQNTGSYFTALDNVSFSLYKGECTLIGGANGSGKSILMSIIAGLQTPTRGKASCTGRCGLVFQDADTQILGETPAEDIMFGLKNLKVAKDDAQKRCRDALEKTGLLKRTSFPARFLSGGEKRRLAVAGILAMDCPVIIFDEPYANLDYTGVVQVNNLIRMLKKDGRTVVLLTHELEKCYALADRFMVLYAGQLVFDGSPDEGLACNLTQWNIRHPLCTYKKREDLLWT